MEEITAKEIMEKIDKALKQFGEYNYFDKSANEIMDISEIYSRLKDLPAEKIISILEDVNKNHNAPGPFLEAITLSFQDEEGEKVDELFKSEIFNEYY